MSEERDETARRYREAAEARLSGLTVEAAGSFNARNQMLIKTGFSPWYGSMSG
jgi:hypothetical protein